MTFMSQTWMSGNKVDGFSWHNYWDRGQEASTLDSSCSVNSDHTFQAFPQTLKTLIRNMPKPTFITEADLLSPCIGGTALSDKGTNLIGSQNGGLAAQSVIQFVRNNVAAHYVAIWNVTIAYDTSTDCAAPGGNNEFGWHEAFSGNTSSATDQMSNERYWFRVWWLNR